MHHKYQYFPVNRTSSGKWAVCDDPNEYDRTEVTPAKLQKIVFVPEIYYDVSHYSDRYISKEFPEPIWKRKENTVVCSQGVYFDELFRIKNEDS